MTDPDVTPTHSTDPLLAQGQATTDHVSDEATTVAFVASSLRDSPKEKIGRFLLRERLGEGAFGVVYKAYDPQLDREVALKISKVSHLASAEMTERFLREARSAANLRHPHIVPLFEAGQEGPHAYLASAFIAGKPLDVVLREQRPDVRTAVVLVRKLADALAYAHGQGIVHRDMKPANVLIDDAGEPHLLDFGLAMRNDGAERLTQEGTVLGTPVYMAPEAAAGRTQDINASSDQYSLGCTLYELLVGRPPFLGSIQQLIADHIHTEPLSPRQRRKDLSRDLETVVLKCLTKEPTLRYSSCQALSDDLRRWLDGEPIHARRLGLGERLAKWVRRNPAVAALTSAVVVSLAIGAGVAMYFALQAREEADKERRTSQSLETTLGERNEALSRLQVESAAREEASQGREALYRMTAYARSLDKAGDELRARNILYARHALSELAPDLHGWEADFRERQCHLQARELIGHREQVTAVACSPDGKFIASGGAMQGARGELILWNAETGEIRHTLEIPGGARGVAISPDGKQVAGVGGRELRLWNTESGELLHTIQAHSASANCVAFHPDGKQLATGGQDKAVHLWDVETGERRATLPLFPAVVLGIAFNADGSLLAAAGGNTSSAGEVRVWDVASRQLTFKPTTALHKKLIRGIAFSPDGSLIATVGMDMMTLLIDPRTGRKVREMRSPLSSGHTSVAFRPDGLRLAVGNGTGRAILYEVGSGEELGSLVGHGRDIQAVAYSFDGRTLVTASKDQRLLLWPQTVSTTVLERSGLRRWSGIAFAPDGSTLTLASGEDDKIPGEIRMLDARTGQDRWTATITDALFQVVKPVYRPDGSTVACLFNRSTVKEWEASSGRERRVLKIDGKQARDLAYRPDGRALAVADDDGFVHCFGPEGTDEVLRFAAHEKGVTVLAYHPDGSLLATGARNQEIRLWDAVTGEARGTLPAQMELIRALAFSPSGRYLAAIVDGITPSWPILQVWDMPERRERFALTVFSARTALAFSLDSARIVVDVSGNPSFFDTRTGRELFHLDAPFTSRMAFDPAGERLAVTSYDGVLRVWSNRTDEARRTIRGMKGSARHVALSPDGATILCVGGQSQQHAERGELRAWNRATGREVFAHESSGMYALHAAYAPDGKTFAVAWHRAVSLHEAATGRSIARLESPKNPVKRVVWKPDGSVLAIASSDPRIRLWSPATGQERFLSGHTSGVSAIAWHPRGDRLASSSEDVTIKGWDVASGQVLGSVGVSRATDALAFSPDGQILAAGGRDRVLRAWTSDLKESFANLPTLTFIYDLAFSPDGNYLATAGGHSDQPPELRLWNARTWKPIQRFSGHPVPVRGVAFTPDSKQLFSASDDRTLKLWDVPGN